jgi:hypothetical protein
MQEVENAIGQLEAEIARLKESLPRWETKAINKDGSREYRGLANQIVLQARKLKEVIKRNTY